MIRIRKILVGSGWLAIGFLLVLLVYHKVIPNHPRPTNRLPPPQFLVRSYTNQCLWHLLPNLSVLSWPQTPVAPIPTGRRFPNGTIYHPPRTFEPKMSHGQRLLTDKLLQVFAKLMFDNGMGDRFFLMGGTLLGSYRHHDLIPWDDDVDILVDVDVRPRMLKLLESLEPEFVLSESGYRLKLHTPILPPENDTGDVMFSRNISMGGSIGWPYLDISYYKVRPEYVYEIFPYLGRHFHWPISVVFPLMFRPLGKNWYPVPYRTQYFIRGTHPLGENCLLGYWNHVIDRPIGETKQPCASLGKQYAFVRRGALKPESDKALLSLVEENLQMDDSVSSEKTSYHTLFLPGHAEDAWLDPYDYTL